MFSEGTASDQTKIFKTLSLLHEQIIQGLPSPRRRGKDLHRRFEVSSITLILTSLFTLFMSSNDIMDVIFERGSSLTFDYL